MRTTYQLTAKNFCVMKKFIDTKIIVTTGALDQQSATRRNDGVDDHLTTLSPRLTVFLWCSEFPSCLAPFEIGYNVEGLPAYRWCVPNGPEEGSLFPSNLCCAFFAVKTVPWSGNTASLYWVHFYLSSVFFFLNKSVFCFIMLSELIFFFRFLHCFSTVVSYII